VTDGGVPEEGARGPSRVPDDVEALVARREAARARRDFEAADELRDRIRDAGFAVTDTLEGPRLSPVEVEERPASTPTAGALDRAADADATLQWLPDRWPEDVHRGIESFDRFAGGRRLQHVVMVEPGHESGWPTHVDVVVMPSGRGWSAARNAGFEAARGRIVMVLDGSIEATGDVVGPLEESLSDHTLGITGPFGLLTDDLREFRPSSGPEVDAVEAYLIAVRRDLLADGLRFDEKFRFYRSADLDLSFQAKAGGLRVAITPVPVLRHDHRAWTTTPEDERARLSKRNFYRFLDRWRGRSDLLVSRQPGASRRD
jgi:cysteinyl-tRNA synthetase